MLNSWILDNKAGASPSFKEAKDSIVMTANRRNHLRKFHAGISFQDSTSKGRRDNTAQQLSTYYAQNVNERKKNPFTNSIISSLHNTPLNTRKTKIYEMNQQWQQKENKGIVMSIKPLSSMKSACNTVSKTQRSDRLQDESWEFVKPTPRRVSDFPFRKSLTSIVFAWLNL